MTRQTTIIAVLLWTLLAFSCNNNTGNKYLYTKHKLLGLNGTYYLLAEVKNDSIHFQGIKDDVACGCYFLNSPSEALPFRPFSGKEITIEKINNNNIIAKILKNGSYETISISKTNDISKYDKLRNNATYLSLEDQYIDSVRNILDIKVESVDKSHLIFDDNTKAMVNELMSDSFNVYIKSSLTEKLISAKKLRDNKKLFLENLKSGKIEIDSAMFSNFMQDYENSIYDRQAFLYVILINPKLFFFNIPLGAVESDVMSCPDCFTKEELDDMYCKLKPYREINKHKLWIFERHGDLKCQVD